VQHQFENTRWESNDNWDRRTAALHGSSYYVLPRVLQWFTGNIGLHHIHHLCSQIPNYRLQECLNALPELKSINRMTLVQSLRTAPLALWDTEKRKLVSFQGI
jgi:omega-6 fatty acid desaturase (delta-12 desaturase)